MTILDINNRPIESRSELEKRTLDILSDPGAKFVATGLAKDILFTDIDYGILNNFTLFPISRNPYGFNQLVGITGSNATIGGQPSEPMTSGDIRSVLFSPKRVTVKETLSQQLIDDMGADLLAYVEKMFKNMINKTIERQIIGAGSATGAEQTNFQAINKDVNVPRIGVTFTGQDTTLGILDQDAVIAMNKTLLWPNFTGSDNFWLVSNNVQDVVDAYGNSMLTYDNLPGHAYGRLLGKPAFNGGPLLAGGVTGGYANTAAILMNKNGYGVAMSDIQIQRISGDTTNAQAGTVTFVADCYVDGKILNYNSIILGGFDSATTA